MGTSQDSCVTPACDIVGKLLSLYANKSVYIKIAFIRVHLRFSRFLYARSHAPAWERMCSEMLIKITRIA